MKCVHYGLYFSRKNKDDWESVGLKVRERKLMLSCFSLC